MTHSTYHILYTIVSELQNKHPQQYDLQTELNLVFEFFFPFTLRVYVLMLNLYNVFSSHLI